MTTLPHVPINKSQYDPASYIDESKKLNHIEFIEFLHSMLLENGIDASFAFPEEPRTVTIEVIGREPAEMSSRTLGVSFRHNRPTEWKKEKNILTNTEETYKIQFWDNTIKVSIWEKNTLDAEKLAFFVESVLIKKYHFMRKHVDNVILKGRLNPGFSSGYNDRKLYGIPLVITFRTSEMFYESNPVIKDIKTDISVI